jgi:hypothetical protein
MDARLGLQDEDLDWILNFGAVRARIVLCGVTFASSVCWSAGMPSAVSIFHLFPQAANQELCHVFVAYRTGKRRNQKFVRFRSQRQIYSLLTRNCSTTIPLLCLSRN